MSPGLANTISFSLHLRNTLQFKSDPQKSLYITIFGNFWGIVFYAFTAGKVRSHKRSPNINLWGFLAVLCSYYNKSLVS